MLLPHLSPILTRLLTLPVTLLILSPLTASVSESPYTGTTSVFIKYTNAETNTDLEDSPRIRLGFNGSDHHVPFIMDTGSVGIIASPDIFTPARGAKYLGQGQQIYSSSGIVENGTWWSATQQIYDADGTLVATANVPVLQVTSITCTSDPRDCSINHNPTGISVMGIGFARESPEQQRGTPDYNAFLNLQSVIQDGVLKPLPADWCNGYVVCKDGVFLGLTADNTANAGFVKLLPWTQYSTPQLSEWMAAPMTVKANGTSGDGNILMDTGVATAFLTPPPDAVLGPLVQCPGSTRVECLPDGDELHIYLPDETQPVAHYKFTVGESGNPMQPDGVHKVAGSKIFLNTSRHVLGGMNFLYDNTNGYIGYIWNGGTPDSKGSVTPATTSSATALISSHNPAKPGVNVTFTATVTGVGSPQIPTGGVTFMIGDNQTFVPLDNLGVATFSTSQLSRGSYTIVAKYSGDATYIRSASSPLIQNIGRY